MRFVEQILSNWTNHLGLRLLEKSNISLLNEIFVITLPYSNIL